MQSVCGDKPIARFQNLCKDKIYFRYKMDFMDFKDFRFIT